MSDSEIKLFYAQSSEVKNRILAPDEHLRAIDTGAYYVAGPDGKPQAVLTATTSAQGVAYPFTKNPGNGKITFEDLRPTNIPVINPTRYKSMGTITSGAISATYDASKGNRGYGSIKIAISAAVTDVGIKIPISADALGRLPKIGSQLQVEIEFEDTSKIGRLYVCPSKGIYSGQTPNYYLFEAANESRSLFGFTDPAMAGQWNGKARPMIFHSTKWLAKVGTVADWGTGKAADRYFETDALYLRFITPGATNIWIHYVCAPDWPIGFASHIMDGTYLSAIENVIKPFGQQGWGGGASLYKAREFSGIDFHPIGPDLKITSDLGWDVFPHTHNISTDLPATATDDVITSIDALRSYLIAAGVNPRGFKWGQFLQDNGNVTDMSAVLKKLGIDGTRGHCVDPEFGYNPYASTYTNQWTTGLESIGAWMGGWASPIGKYNRIYTAWFNWGDVGSTTPAMRDTYLGSSTQKATEFAANNCDGFHSYTHQSVAGGGVDGTNNFDSGINYARDLIADADEKFKAGKLLLLCPSEVERLTYARPGPVYMDAFGNWVYRDDPTTIAF